MKSMPIFLVLILLLALLIPAGVRADINGVGGMRWGSNLADLQQTRKLVLIKEGGKNDTSLYVLENETLRFGKATLTGINYSFAKDRFQGAILLFSGLKNFTAAKAEAFAKFGETTKIDQNGEEMYNWPGTATSVILSYNRKNQSGFVFMKAKKMPPQIKTTGKRPPSSTVPETALDKAPPPASIPPPRSATQPATGQDDLETALDRAPPLPAQSDSARDNITPEIQVLIDRDQALTQLCWETVGPAADAACVQMRQNVERLKSMDMCMRPGSADASSTAAIVWHRCEPATTTAAPVVSQAAPAAPAAQQQAIPLGVPQAGEDKSERCRLIGELFAAAARMRDNGSEPQVAEQELAWQVSSQIPGITIERIRETVELVYFDQEYNAIGGESLIQRVSDRCLSGSGPFNHPLP